MEAKIDASGIGKARDTSPPLGALQGAPERSRAPRLFQGFSRTLALHSAAPFVGVTTAYGDPRRERGKTRA